MMYKITNTNSAVIVIYDEFGDPHGLLPNESVMLNREVIEKGLTVEEIKNQ